MRLAENYGKLPSSFEANQGQTDGQVKFLSRGRGYTLFLIGNEAVLALQGKVAHHPPCGAAALPNPLPFSGANKTSNDKLEQPRDRRAGPTLPCSLRPPKPVIPNPSDPLPFRAFIAAFASIRNYQNINELLVYVLESEARNLALSWPKESSP